MGFGIQLYVLKILNQNIMPSYPHLLGIGFCHNFVKSKWHHKINCWQYMIHLHLTFKSHITNHKFRYFKFFSLIWLRIAFGFTIINPAYGILLKYWMILWFWVVKVQALPKKPVLIKTSKTHINYFCLKTYYKTGIGTTCGDVKILSILNVFKQTFI